MNLQEFADLLEAAGKALKEPIVVPSSPNPTLIKLALSNVSHGGVKALQTALGVTADGIIGPITKSALEVADINVLLTSLSNLDKQPLSFEVLAPEYHDLYLTMIVRPEYASTVDDIVTKIRNNFPRYNAISSQTGVPNNVIGIMHSLESDLRFSRHLHNGDPLSQRTVNVPSGRPPPSSGDPPFLWEESALDDIAYEGLDKWHDWSPEGVCYVLENKNGWGYRLYHPAVKSPYLWSFTSIYSSGKYDADGHFDPNLVSEQCGGMAILKGLLS
jgi:lysozyme family protein